MSKLDPFLGMMRAAFLKHADISEKRMMGGVCFIYQGNMLGGVDQDAEGLGRFMFRVGKEQETETLARPGTSPVILGGRRMGGMIFLDAAHGNGAQLDVFAALAFAFVGNLLPK